MKNWLERFPWTAAALRFVWVDARRRRRVAVVGALALLALFATHGALSAWAGHRLSAVADEITDTRGPLDGIDQAGPPPVPPAANRAKAVRAAAELLVLDDARGSHTDSALIGRLAQSDAEPDEETWTQLAAIVDKNAIALGLLDEASRRPVSNWGIPYREGVSADLPPLLGLVQLAKLNVAAGRLELRRRHPDAAVDIALRGLAMVESLRDEPILIVQLVRISMLRFHLGLVREILAHDGVDAGRLAALSAMVDGIEVRRPLEAAIVWEMRAMRDVLFVPDVTRMTRSDDSWIGTASIRWLLRPLILENLRHYLVVMDDFASRAAEPPYRREATRSSAADGPRWLYFLAQMAIIDTNSVVERGDVAEAACALARSALVVERRHPESGAYPDSLPPRDSDSVPVDPFTGEPLHYERTGAGYTLSSAGTDIEARLFPGAVHLLRWEKRTAL